MNFGNDVYGSPWFTVVVYRKTHGNSPAYEIRYSQYIIFDFVFPHTLEQKSNKGSFMFIHI